MPTQPKPLPMPHALLVILAGLLGASASLCAAEYRVVHEKDTATASTPVATVLGGMKDLEVGMQGEYYLNRGRFSLFAGAGYVLPDPENADLPKGPVLTFGGRAFTSGLKHRAFVELSYGPLARGLKVQDDKIVDRVMIHGPSLLLGYQRVANNGLTFLGAGAVGYARWADFHRSFWSFELRLGVGYTWRQRRFPKQPSERYGERMGDHHVGREPRLPALGGPAKKGARSCVWLAP